MNYRPEAGVAGREGTSGAKKKRFVGRSRQQGKIYAIMHHEAEDAP